MNRNWLLFYTILFLGAGALSCSEDVNPTPYNYTKVFTGENSKTWRITHFEQTLNGKVVNRFSAECVGDDRYIFYANVDRKFEARNGSKKCYNPPEPSVIEDSWSFNNASATLNIVISFLADFSLPYIVREAEKEDMVLEIFLDQENTQSYRIHFDLVDED